MENKKKNKKKPFSTLRKEREGGRERVEGCMVMRLAMGNVEDGWFLWERKRTIM